MSVVLSGQLSIPVQFAHHRIDSGMTENTRRWYLVLIFVVAGGAFFGYQILRGQTLWEAGLSSIVWLVFLGVVCLLLLRRQRRSLTRLTAQGQVSCFIRRPSAAPGDPYRKWKSVLVTPKIGVLTVHPVLGGTLITRGSPVTLHVSPTVSSRHPATKWEKFNRFGTNSIVLPLETTEGPIELAGQANSLDTIESSLSETRPSHGLPEQP